MHRTVRHPESNEDTPNKGYATQQLERNVQVFKFVQMNIFDTDSKQYLPVLECSTLNVSYAIGDQPSNTLLEAIHGVKGSDDQCLFIPGVPHSGPDLNEYQESDDSRHLEHTKIQMRVGRHIRKCQAEFEQ